jgi:Raf kinase inhibitor-like YbhB/YbcL family protein
MDLFSSSFKNGDFIPRKYTCDDADISPPLFWENVPEGIVSFALISDDPDAPVGTWVHWVIFNLPGSLRSLSENVPKDKQLDDGSIQGTTDFRRPGYGGPCPPGGTHRYFFKLYALDTMLDLDSTATKSAVEKLMQGHILDQCKLMGKYRR